MSPKGQTFPRRKCRHISVLTLLLRNGSPFRFWAMSDLWLRERSLALFRFLLVGKYAAGESGTGEEENGGEADGDGLRLDDGDDELFRGVFGAKDRDWWLV